MRALYNLNPMTRFINAYRNCLYDVRMPNLGDVAYLVVVAALALGVGMLVFSHLEPRLAEEL
jgi:ABC-2 type transport system permease protein